MRGHTLLVVEVMIILFEISVCDIHEGIVGLTSELSWIGVLKVHIDEDDTHQMAVTGIVLIKPKFVLANADDVVRIPKPIFYSQAEIMFMTEEVAPWVFRPKKYVTHPEYEIVTMVSIAIVELDLRVPEDNPLPTISLPEVAYDSNFLYITGFMEEEAGKLDKVLYRMRYLSRRECDQFYGNEGLNVKKQIPSSYMCCYQQTTANCLWDNGLALVSNSSGVFSLIGLSVHGPGCGAPARFIYVSTYQRWIHSITRDEEDDDSRQNTVVGGNEYIPVHETFKLKPDRRYLSAWPPGTVSKKKFHIAYPFQSVAKMELDHFGMEILDDSSVAIYPCHRGISVASPFANGSVSSFRGSKFQTFWDITSPKPGTVVNNTQEQYVKACQSYRALMYREHFELKARKGSVGSVIYKLDMFDLIVRVCTCVKLYVECKNRTQAILTVQESVDYKAGTQMMSDGSDLTPEEIFKIYPITERTDNLVEKKKQDAFDIKYLEDFTPFVSVLSYGVSIKFDFTEDALLKFEIYGYPKAYGTTTVIPFRRKAPTADPRAARKMKKKTKNTQFWGMPVAGVDKTIRQAEVTLDEEHADVYETVNDAPCHVASAALIAVGSILVRVYTRRFSL